MKINRTNDYVFAKIFGDPKHKDITLSLINAVFEFEGTALLEDIEFVDRTLSPEYFDGKLSRLDISGRSKNGTKVNIEMQVVNEHNIERRTLYYWAKLYTTLEKGQDYNELTRTVTINLLNFSLLPTVDYHNMYSLYNSKQPHQLINDMEIHFIEMPKWKSTSPKEMRRLDYWVAYFTNKVSESEMEEIAMQEPTIQEALQMESLFTQDDVARRQYEQREKAIMDYNSAMSAAKRIGLHEGRQEGRQEGIQEGIQKNSVAVAINMLQLGLSVDIIAKSTGLSIDEIKQLQR